MKKQLLFLIVTAASFSLYGQSSPSTDDIFIGAMLSRAYYDNYYQVQQMGANLIFQRAIVELPNQGSNFDSLKLFDNLIAGNDSGYAHYEENRDWIYYFTNAYYSKWEAEGNTDCEFEVVGLKKSDWVGTIGNAVHTGMNTANTNKYLFNYGPNYSQYLKYVYSNKLLNNALVRYHAVFWLKLSDNIPENNPPICELTVSFINTETEVITPLNSRIVTANELLTTEYKAFDVEYDYTGYTEAEGNEHGIAHGPEWIHPFSLTEPDFFKEKYKILFNVKWLGNADLYVDFIEVYDQQIWKNYFSNTSGYQEMLSRILTYNQQFSPLGTKLKYYHTVDEPHSIDCMEPIRKVQEILDSLNLNADLLVHFYPGWNNYRDSIDILKKWVNRAEPKKLDYWYFPYVYDNNGNPVSDANLYSTFSSISQYAEDQLIKKILKQLGSPSLIGKTEYIGAIE